MTSYFQLDRLPAEVTLTIANYLPFKTYIQYSQTCKAVQNVLVSTHLIRYLNGRFRFGQDDTTGALLLFAFHNIVSIPKNIRMIILQHFIHCIKRDRSFIRAWSLVHAIHCSNPGKFIDLFASEHGEPPRRYALEAQTKKKQTEIIRRQYTFTREINDGIITASIPHKQELCNSKTYQSIFKNFIQTGNLCTIENCLRSLGPPINSTIVLTESDYDERCPIFGELSSSRKSLNDLKTYQDDSCPHDDNSVEAICRQSRFLHYSAQQLRALAQALLKKYHVNVAIIRSRDSKSDASDRDYNARRKERRRHRRRETGRD